MQTLGPMDSSLTHTVKVFLSPHGQQRERIKQDIFCIWSFGPMGNSLTHTQSRNVFPPWAAGKNASSKVKVLWLGSDFVITKTMETKSGDHREITYGMVLKPHKLHKLHYFQTHSLYLRNFRKTLNNLTSTKFVRFSNFSLIKRFSINFPCNKTR